MLVLGAHRSGTSATTAALAALGLGLGAGALVPANHANEGGHFESEPLRLLNDEILERLGGSWAGPPALGGDWVADAQLDSLRPRALVAFAEAFPSPWWLWKDPRNCHLLPFWLDLLGIDPLVVAVHRNPIEVAASLQRRDGISLTVGLALWERATRDLLVAVAGRRTVVIDHDSLLRDPAQSVGTVARALGAWGAPVSVSPEPLAAAAAQLDPTRQHERAGAFDDDLLSEQQRKLQAVVAGTLGVHSHFDEPDLPPPSPWLGVLLAEHHRSWTRYERLRADMAAQRPAKQPYVNVLRAKVTVRRQLDRLKPRRS